jgi:hypothetical protein
MTRQRYTCVFCGQGGADTRQPVACHNCKRDGMRPAGPPEPTLLIGDRVAYARRWIVAVQAHEFAFWRGTVIEEGGVLLRVQWDDGHAAGTPVLARNLVRLDRVHLESV